MNSSEIVAEMRMVEQQKQQLMMQRQSFQFEQNQILNARDEVKKTNDDVYKMISGAMIKVAKDQLLKELEEKLKSLTLHVETIEKQEKMIDSRVSELQKELKDEMTNKKSK
jgi:prefoldin beta subunit